RIAGIAESTKRDGSRTPGGSLCCAGKPVESGGAVRGSAPHRSEQYSSADNAYEPEPPTEESREGNPDYQPADCTESEPGAFIRAAWTGLPETERLCGGGRSLPEGIIGR